MLGALKFFAEGLQPQEDRKKPPSMEMDCGENEDSDEGYQNKKHLRAFDDLDAIGQAVVRQLAQLTKEFEEEACRIIGVVSGTPWSLQDMKKALGAGASLGTGARR